MGRLHFERLPELAFGLAVAARDVEPFGSCASDAGGVARAPCGFEEALGTPDRCPRQLLV
jgi:hypothetical protein